MPVQNSSSRKRLLALAGGLFVGLVAVEAFLQVADVQPTRYRPPRFKAFDGNTFRRSDMWGDGLIKQPSPLPGIDMGQYTPGARFRVEYDSNPRGYFDEHNGVEMTVNQLGLRGPETSRDKPTGTLRLLGLGDSFTFGVGVQDQHTFLRRLETRLANRLRNQQPVEVLNAGTQGYNTRDQQLNLEHRWLELKPDVVLVVFYLNDIYRDEAAVAFWNNGEGDGVYLQPSGWARYSLLIDWCQYAWRARQLRQSMIAHYSQAYFTSPRSFFQHTQQPQDSDSQHMDWPASRAALLRIVELAKQHDFQVGLAIFPELMSLDDYPFVAIHSFVEETCDEIGLKVHDLLPAFQGKQDHTLWVHPTDHHPNEIAHDIAARSLEPFLHSLIKTHSSTTRSQDQTQTPQ